MKKFLIGLSILGLTNLAYPHHPESGACNNFRARAHITPSNKEYLKKVQQTVSASRVLGLQKIAAEFDLKKSDFFAREGNTYEITFKKGGGTIVAIYDREGNILQTFEKFDNVRLPLPIRNSVWKHCEGGTLKKNTYEVFYSDGRVTKAIYKVWIFKDGHQKKLVFDAKGEIV